MEQAIFEKLILKSHHFLFENPNVTWEQYIDLDFTELNFLFDLLYQYKVYVQSLK